MSAKAAAVTPTAAKLAGEAAGKTAVKQLIAETGGHPGWKPLADAMVKDGMTREAANASIGRATHGSSAAARAANPNLLKVRNLRPPTR